MTLETVQHSEVAEHLLEPSGENRWILNFGPQHPATHTTLRLILEIEGELIVKCTPVLGYLHCGFEKLGEHHTFNQFVTVTDRMNYISPMANNITWHMACEKLLGIEVPPRCQYLRVIMAELSRISDHWLSIGAAALDLGALTAFVYGFNEREKLYELFETHTGARFTNSFTRVGGLARDVTDTFADDVRAFLPSCRKVVEDFERLLNNNRIFLDRTREVGVLTREEAINRGATGPIARASGVERDLRKDEPYLCYADLDFRVPIMTIGDCYGRYLVRLEEVKQSMRIIEQAVENIPEGPVNVDLRGTEIEVNQKVVLPPKDDVYDSIEGLIQHFEMVMSNRGFPTPREEVYVATETANGELGYTVVGDGTDVAYRARCRPPSFLHYSLTPHLIEGSQISDIVAVLGSLNIIAGELDR